METQYVIAGGSRGIGRAVVQALAAQASRIDVYSRSLDALELTDQVRHHPCDFLEEELRLEDLPDVIHGAVYCPGSINLRSFRSLKPADFRADLELNLLGAVKFLQACLPGLQRGGSEQPSSVVLFSTVAVGKGMPMHASIAAAKGAVEGLTRSLAAELAPHVRVNCIAPALTDTPLAARLLRTPEQRAAMAAKYPLRRIGLASDIAAATRFLLSQESSWITGQVLGVDGGMSAVHTGS